MTDENSAFSSTLKLKIGKSVESSRRTNVLIKKKKEEDEEKTCIVTPSLIPSIF